MLVLIEFMLLRPDGTWRMTGDFHTRKQVAALTVAAALTVESFTEQINTVSGIGQADTDRANAFFPMSVEKEDLSSLHSFKTVVSKHPQFGPRVSLPKGPGCLDVPCMLHWALCGWHPGHQT